MLVGKRIVSFEKCECKPSVKWVRSIHLSHEVEQMSGTSWKHIEIKKRC